MTFGAFCWWLVHLFIGGFYVCDAINLSFMEKFDVIYELNGWFWLAFWVFLLIIDGLVYKENE